MLIDSTWIQTNAISAELEAAAVTLGAHNHAVPIGTGLQYRIPYTFSDSHDTDWEISQSTGTWYCSLVELVVVAPLDRTDRLVGVVGPRASLVEDLVQRLGDDLRARGLSFDAIQFPLRPLLGPDAIDAGLQPLSVRPHEEGASTLVKADDWPRLRESLAAVNGDIAGITLRASDEVFSVLPGGSIVFDEPTTAGVVAAVTAVRQALLVPEAY